MINIDNVQPLTPEQAQAMEYQVPYSDEFVDLQNAIDNSMEKFDDEPKGKVEQAKATIKNFADYLRSDNFVSDVKNIAKENNIPEKRLAQTFIGKVLGTLSDILGIAIGCVRNGVHAVINILSSVLNGAVDLICNVADSLLRIGTLNKTAKATA